MRFEIRLNENDYTTKINPDLYHSYSIFLYNRMRKTIKKKVHSISKKYKVREPLILESSLIKWYKGKPPKSINLVKYFDDCIELIYEQGIYVIQINHKKLIDGSNTSLLVLLRILEYGTNKIPELPVLRAIFKWYKENYNDLLDEYLEEVFH